MSRMKHLRPKDPEQCPKCWSRKVQPSDGQEPHWECGNAECPNRPRPGELEGLLREMFAADEAYGVGFYNDEAWRAAYDRLRALSAWKPR